MTRENLFLQMSYNDGITPRQFNLAQQHFLLHYLLRLKPNYLMATAHSSIQKNYTW